jgi:GNAT superfamily N-acetyltransferase
MPTIGGDVRFASLTPRRWKDLAALFGRRGACAGCWCMFWRLTREQYRTSTNERNRRAFRRLVESGAPTGIIAYDASGPIGWCSVAPRGQFKSLATSKNFGPVDDAPAWSITCFYIAPRARRTGLARRLLIEALAYARKRGAELVEGYPVEVKGTKVSSGHLWHGSLSMFETAGFREVARRLADRPIVRRRLRQKT